MSQHNLSTRRFPSFFESLEDRRLLSTTLTGTPLGTPGAWNNSGNDYTKALDNNINTYFDSSQSNGAYVGLDLGSSKPITAVQFAPRTGLSWRMVGGQIQGSNNNSTWTTLGTISSQPADNTPTTLTLANPGSYRYVRYLSPNSGFCNIAEIHFLSDSTSTSAGSGSSSAGKLTGTPIGTAGSWNNSGNTFAKALDNNPSTYFDSSQANGAYVGFDLGSSQFVSSVKFMPRTSLGSRMVGGIFQGSNNDSSWTTLATISSSPADNQYTTLNFPNPASYRYVRYVSPNSGYGNIAEIEFDGSPSSSGSTGSPVTVTPPPTNANAPKPVIDLLENSVTAGMSIHASATSSILNSGSPATARYEWNFGDPNGKYNSLVGFNAAHVYDNPGTYTVTLKVTNEAGVSSTTTSKVTINADNRRTIYVDSNRGNDSNAGTSSSAPVRTAARAFQLLSNNTKILFQRGETFPVKDFLYATYSNITIGDYGSAANNPLLLWQGSPDEWREIISPSATATRDMTVQNLSFSSTSGLPTGIAPRGINITIRNCYFTNCSEAINSAGNPTGLLVQDNTQPANANVTDYFLWLQGTDAVVLGNNVGAGGMYAIRTSGGTGQTITRALFAYNTLSNNDRSNLRVQKGSYCYAANNTISNSGVEFGPLGSSDGFADPNWSTARSDYDVFENNVLNLTDQRYVRISAGTEHISIRNNVIRHDGLGEAISIEGYDPAFNRQVNDAYIVNNTIIDYSTIGQAIKLVAPERDAEITLENNLYIAPNLPIGTAAGNAPVYVNAPNLNSFRIINNNIWSLPASETGWAHGGVNFVGTTYALPTFLNPTSWNAAAQVGTDLFADVPISGNYTPSGQAATSATPAPGVFTDLYGKARPSFNNWSAGAVQA